MKKAVSIIIAVIVAVAAIVLLLLSNLNSLVAKVIEEQGGKVTQTSVRVSGVEISLREGRGSIEGLRVASPDGYKARDAFTLEDITVDIDIKSLRQEPIVIDEIRIKAPAVNVEVTKTGASNIEELRKNVQAYAADQGGESDESRRRSKRIRIDQFVFEEGSVVVDASALGLEKRTITLPEIRLIDVGGSEGAPPDEIAKIILAAVAKKATSEIASSELGRSIRDELGGSITDKAKGLLDKIRK
jgi:hypothetical protein